MHISLPLRKLVIELRYKPELGFYGKMDVVASSFADKFPDWERSPLTVEVRSKSKHRRVFLSHHRCFYEADLESAAADTEFSFAEKVLLDVCSELAVRDVKRVGMRQWFACDLEKAFALMVDETIARFFSPSQELLGILNDKAHDVAYVVDYETAEGWKYHLRLGPMTKEQWFQTVRYERGLFGDVDRSGIADQDASDASATFEDYRKTIPENFLFIDIDCYEEGLPMDRFSRKFDDFRRRSRDLVTNLIRYCQK